MSTPESITSTDLVVAGLTVLQDASGRYNLNILYQASACDKERRPSDWLRLKSTKALIAALQDQVGDLPLETVHGGNRRGTYAHELLAVSYAGWIAPAFQLTVNQAFIDMRTARHDPQALALPPDLVPAIQGLVQTMQLMVTATQHTHGRLDAHEASITAIAERLERLEAITTKGSGYVSMMGYAKLRKFHLSTSEASVYGHKAVRMAKRLKINIGDVPDERYGRVHTYPLELLDEIFAPVLQAEQTIHEQC